MQKFNDYDKVKGYSDAKQLPKDGYVLRIMNAEEKENRNGKYIQISCDIEEGEYKGFFMDDWKSQEREDKKWHCNYLLNEPKDDGSEKDGWTKRRFKTVVEALEDSNSGYHWDWDERKWKGKLIGGLFNIREYESQNGEIRQATNLKQLCSVEKIHSGSYKLPKDDLLERKPESPVADSEFMPIPDSSDDVPWS